ncbi:MAG: FtsX-like permease family protein [Planctomycetota bacterium]
MDSLRPSLSLAFSSLRAKRIRTCLLIAAAALASSLIVAVSCTMGSVQKTLEGEITKLLGATDVRITHSSNARFDDAILDTVASWDGVEFVNGIAQGSITLIHADARRDAETNRIVRATITSYGTNLPLESEVRPLPLRDGAWPMEPNEILLDPMAAEELQATVGDTLKIQYVGPPIELTVAGIYERKTMGILQRPVVRLSRDLLEQATGRSDEIVFVAIGLEEGLDADDFSLTYGGELDETLLLEPAELFKSGFDRRIMVSRLALIIATMLTFTSAAFIIVTGLTTSVTEQQRLLAIIRCLGGSRLQLFAMQVCVGLIVGSFGAILGIPIGIALASTLVWVFDHLLTGGFAIPALGIWLAVFGSLGAGLLGAVYPAWQASQISPLRALSVAARPATARTVIGFAIAGLALIAIQVLLYQVEDHDLRYWTYAYAGLHAMYIGYFLLATVVLVLVVRALARPLAKLLGLPRDIIHGSMLATPYRHGFTAGALMVGVALMVATWSTTMSILDGWVRDIQFADGFAFQLSGMEPEEVEAIRNLDAVTEVSVIGMVTMETVGQQVFGVEGYVSPMVQCLSFDPESFFRINAITWVAGSAETAIPKLKSGEGLIVAERFLTARGITVGDEITLRTGRLEETFEIVGVVEANGLDIVTQLYGFRNRYMDYALSCVFMDSEIVAEVFDNRDSYMMQVNLSDDFDDQEVAAQIAEAAPGVRFISGRWVVDTIDFVAAAILTVQTTIAFAALVLASIGVGNVLLAGVHDRRFEFGVLRSVGGSRRTIVRLILGEATLLAIAGAITGTMLGCHIAYMDTQNLRWLGGIDAPLVIQIIPTIAGWLVLLVLTLLVSLPGALSVTRSRPSELISAGRPG